MSEFKDIDQLDTGVVYAFIGQDGAIYIADDDYEICVQNRQIALALRDWLNKALED